MDGILVHNHLRYFLGKNYKDKAGYLAELKVPGLGALRQLVIDPRNDIEHDYTLATEDQARRAYDVAELFLGATDQEAGTPAVMAHGWPMFVNIAASAEPGKEFFHAWFDLTKDHAPFLIITGYEPEPDVLVMYPNDEMISTCPLKSFSSDQVIKLNARMRECFKTDSYSLNTMGGSFVRSLKERMKL